MLPPDPFPHVILPLKEFLLIETCPPEWKDLDLYLVRDDQVVFYVGQSYTAFDRVWQHIFDAFKGRSTVGQVHTVQLACLLRFHHRIDVLPIQPLQRRGKSARRRRAPPDRAAYPLLQSPPEQPAVSRCHPITIHRKCPSKARTPPKVSSVRRASTSKPASAKPG